MNVRFKIIICCSLLIPIIYSGVPHSYQSPTNNSPAKYDRSLFGRWSDTDGDCQNMRHELLQERSTDIVTLSENGCRAVVGKWLDPYTGNTFFESNQLDIDHLVPLKYSWERGAYSWTAEKRIRFSNDRANLFAVQKSVNRQKAAFGPLNWLPPNIEYRCQYIRDFQKIVDLYELKQTSSELREIQLKKTKFCN